MDLSCAEERAYYIILPRAEITVVAENNCCCAIAYRVEIKAGEKNFATENLNLKNLSLENRAC